ncbi:MAG: EAL domain-containing protein [Kastovskya adunca ATA6-11-RM4]|jgi:diguanylate cyclase (GGDEF)-like protein/PAS domain S-box-containing protein|nr:EAL domain-containing protein [Kastovskya adunca ATA6-11-RM4]
MIGKGLSARHQVRNIVFIYTFFSSLWILVSDWLLAQFIDDGTLLTQLQIIKGWAFVFVTSAFLYALVSRAWRLQQESYNLLRAVVEGTTDAIFVKNHQGCYLMANSTTADIFGKLEEEILGQDDTAFLSPETARQIMETDRKIMTTGQTESLEEVLTLNGITRIFLSTKDTYRDAQGNILGIIGVARDITERKQLQEELRREREDLLALTTITSNSISTLDLDELLDVLLRRIVEVMKADAAVILLKEEDHLFVRASLGVNEDVWSEDNPNLKHRYSVPMGQGFAGTIASTMQPLYLEDAQSDPRVLNPRLKEQGIRTMLGVPLHRRRQVIGVLHVDWLNLHPRQEQEIHLLEITAERCAMAILNAQLFEQTKQLKERLQLQFDRMPIGCILGNKDLQITDWNPAAEQIFGFTKADVLGKHPWELFITPEVWADVEAIFEQLALEPMAIAHNINENRTKDGRIILCEWYNLALKEADGSVMGFLSMVIDVTEKKKAEEELCRREQLYRTIARNYPDGAIFLFDQELRYTLADGAGLVRINLSRELLEGKTIWEIGPLETCEVLEPNYRATLAGTKTCFEIPYVNRIYAVQTLPVKNDQGDIFAGMVVAQDITERKLSEVQLRRYAFYDSLTNLPNRALFLDRLELLTVKQLQDNSGLFALLFLDLDGFEIVKYSLGHGFADQLIVTATDKLKRCLRPSDTLARLGSDKFAILLPNIKDASVATNMAEQIHQQLLSAINLGEHEVFAAASIGIVLSGQESEASNPEDLLRAADTAMHYARVHRQASYAVFDPLMQAEARERLQLQADLRRAIAQSQFQVYYQPIISLNTGKIVGFEALIRWQHPERGMVSPDKFIPLAEETGLIGQIDRWVWREACRQLRAWHDKFPRQAALTMSVNVSSKQLAQLGLLEQLDNLLREAGIQGRSLKLEITESAMMENTAVELVILEQLKTLGIQFSIDDFGTGYSSLGRLHQLPIDTLKIDRSFVSRLGADKEALEIVRTVTTLAHILEMDVTAEGVETQEQWEQLRSLNCEYGQGYLFAKPLTSQGAEALLAAEVQF